MAEEYAFLFRNKSEHSKERLQIDLLALASTEKPAARILSGLHRGGGVKVKIKHVKVDS